MLSLITVAVVFSIVIFVHELGHFLAARRMGVKVERFSLGFGKALFSIKRGDTEYSLNMLPFGGYVKMSGEEPSDARENKPWEFCSNPPGKRFWILFSGAAINYLLAFCMFCFVAPVSKVGLVIKDMPAYNSGIKTADEITAIDSKNVRYWHEVLDILSKDKDKRPIVIDIKRDNKPIRFEVVPVLMESKNMFGAKMQSAKIGISYYGDISLIRGNPLVYLRSGLRQTIDNTVVTYRYIWYLITGRVSVKGSVTGPIGIAVILGKAAKIGMPYLLFLIAHINIALAIFNLLPFPVLDGGHIMFLGLERIRKRPLRQKTQEIIQYAAISVLVAFMVFVTYNDIFMLKFLK